MATHPPPLPGRIFGWAVIRWLARPANFRLSLRDKKAHAFGIQTLGEMALLESQGRCFHIRRRDSTATASREWTPIKVILVSAAACQTQRVSFSLP
jgi:hypothetical protein